MGSIVKISEDMHENLRISSNAPAARSTRKPSTGCASACRRAALNLDHHAICRLLIRAEQNGGLDLQHPGRHGMRNQIKINTLSYIVSIARR